MHGITDRGKKKERKKSGFFHHPPYPPKEQTNPTATLTTTPNSLTKTGNQNDADTHTGIIRLQLHSCLEVVVGFREIVDTHCRQAPGKKRRQHVNVIFVCQVKCIPMAQK